jgi:hypothetical protein
MGKTQERSDQSRRAQSIGRWCCLRFEIPPVFMRRHLSHDAFDAYRCARRGLHVSELSTPQGP